MKGVLCAIVSALMSLSVVANAQEPQQCIENPERETPCQHTIYKKADPDVLQRSALESPVVCICVSDFTESYAQLDNDTVRVTTDTWLAEWQLSREDLLQLLRY